METKIKHNKKYIKLSTEGSPSVYLLNLKDTGRVDLCKKDFGCYSKLNQQNKTIMLLGATGSGKTTLINGMINYIMGVEWNDSCRLKLIDEQTNKTQAESQTSEVTAYQIHYQDGYQVPYSVTIIDTPGFGDTRGIAQDKEITEKIRMFFSREDGIIGLDAVCFVVQSALARLTQTQKYIFEAILSIFGKDIANNITVMITFADGQKPPVLAAIEAADIPCGKKQDGTLLHFKFNNSALFAQNNKVDDDEDNFDEIFWKMGNRSMKRFFNRVKTMETKSLQLTKEVLFERKHLEAVVSGVQPLIQTGLKTLEEIKMTRAALEQNQNVIKENENFEYELEVSKIKKIDVKKGTFVTNCHGCNFTCHYPCIYANDEDEIKCTSMENDICKVCPGQCVLNMHHNMSYRFETETVKEKRTYANLKKQYEELLGGNITIEKIINQLEEEYEDVQYQVLQLNDQLAKSLTRLKEIAFRPDPLSTPGYIELLIESEKQMAKDGFLKRIAELENLKKQAFILEKVEKGEALTEFEQGWRSKIVQKLKDNHQSNYMEDKIKHNNNYTKLSTGSPSVYLLNLKDTGRVDLCKKDFGCSNKLNQQNKTIILLGATGSGKTTLINRMINYIMGVEWNDSCRLKLGATGSGKTTLINRMISYIRRVERRKLIDEQTNKTQAESQTSEVTAYKIHYQDGYQVPYSVTIIDTPGFGDTRGIAQDKEITEKIRKFFSEEDGILTLDAVCFVVQSALARLTQAQKYIFEAILSIFGKDIASNITVMITFADGQKPPVLAAIEAADIPCAKKDGTFLHFKFNNSALFAQNKEVDDDEDNFDEMFWKMANRSMKRFFNHLETMETKSLQLTKEVLFERKHLEAVVSGVQPLIQTGLKTLEEIKMTTAALFQNQNVIKENENFEYELDVPKIKKIDVEKGKFVTNCNGCNFTCHYPCAYANDEDKINCSAMKNGNCEVCPGQCVWNVHHNMSYRFETETVKEKRTYANLKKQYKEALGENMTIEKIINQLEEEYEDEQYQVLQLNDKLAKSLTRLKEIALRPDPLSTPGYIELLIESEKQMAKDGFIKRIAELENLKKRALILEKVEKGESLTEFEQGWRSKMGQRLKDNHQSNYMESKIKHNKNNYTKLSTGSPSVYLLNLKDTGRVDLCKKDFGCSNKLTNQQNKTIMLLGATGSGKTTLINGMINYILGVEWSDSCRLKLIDEQTSKTQAESQTSEVTAYQIHYQDGNQVPYSVTIIDTPGFGDTRGIAQDKEITEKIRIFFSREDGILTLDAVCFVVQSALARLTQTQKYIFEAILSIFGKDISNNITVMITFADGQKPPVLEAIEAADIPCAKKDGTLLHFKFNNSALFAQNNGMDNNEDNFDEMFWKMGKGSMKRFFNHLGTMETKSLQLTKEVLSERKNLEAVVSGVQPLIQTGLKTLEEIKMTRAALEQNQNVIKENENFEYELEVPKIKKIDVKKGTFVTNCHGCNFTCHYPCIYANDEDKINCSSMKKGNCTVCPGQCVWNVHHNMTYRFETETVKEKRTYANLKNKYEEALGKTMTIEKIINQLEEEYEDVQYQVLLLNDKLAKSLTRLKEIALRPDPLSTPGYIELLIESEKQMAKDGFIKRIAELENLKKQAFILEKVEKGEALTELEQGWRSKMGQRLKGVFNNVRKWCNVFGN